MLTTSKIITDLALLSSLHSSSGFINIHREIHPKEIQRENNSEGCGNGLVKYDIDRLQKFEESILSKYKGLPYPCTSDRSAWCLDRGGGCALGIRSIVFFFLQLRSKVEVLFQCGHK